MTNEGGRPCVFLLRTSRWLAGPKLLLLPGIHSSDQAQLWFLDTGYSGEAFAFDYHLRNACLTAPAEPGTTSLAWSLEGQTQTRTLEVWPADLWLVSNVSTVPNTLYCLELNEGIARSNRNVPPFERDHRALIGTRALRRGGLKLEIDFTRASVSI